MYIQKCFYSLNLNFTNKNIKVTTNSVMAEEQAELADYKAQQAALAAQQQAANNNGGTTTP